MIHSLKTENIGPISTMDLTFAKRLNLITGDNGLGKTFLLDIIWWALARNWPREVNKNLTQGYMARPYRKKSGKISFSLTSNAGNKLNYSSTFEYGTQAWTGQPGRPHNPGLVLYAMADGSFAVWDSARNYWKKKGDIDVQDRPPAYVFSAREVWDGLAVDGTQLCNGLIRDWAGWQKENKAPYEALKTLIENLSPDGEPLAPGELTRISLDDARDIPTIRMGYGDESVPIVFASSAIRRILALAYLLIWSIEEHKVASDLLNQAPATFVTFLVDEIEAHLHPRWQRSLMPSLLNAMSSLMKHSSIQYIVTTHSPLVLGSLEEVFNIKDDTTDAWFDIDLNKNIAHIERRDFYRQVSFGDWLTSEAFDLPTDFSLSKEKLYNELSKKVVDPNLTRQEALNLEKKMSSTLIEVDPIWIMWRKFLRSKGWN